MANYQNAPFTPEAPRSASEAAMLRRGTMVYVATREDVEALVGRRVRMEGWVDYYEVTGFLELGVLRQGGVGLRYMEVKGNAPLRIPGLVILLDDAPPRVPPSASEAGELLAGMQVCPDCKNTGIVPGFGFGTSINACDRPCSCDAGKRKADGDGPSEWTVVEREAWETDGTWTAEDVTLRKRAEQRRFYIVADLDDVATVVRSIDANGTWSNTALVRIRGEACIDMAIARLIERLREGMKP